MKEYTVEKLNNETYSHLIVCLTYDSILNYLHDIELELQANNIKGIILIDQLLITGNGSNRFISCEYSDEKLILSTAKNAIPEFDLKKHSIDLLKKNYSFIMNSILNNKQRDMIKEGIVF